MKKQNGITLIALVISIIVMLILAGVSISSVVGDNGILTKAQLAKKEMEVAQEKEELEIMLVNYSASLTPEMSIDEYLQTRVDKEIDRVFMVPDPNNSAKRIRAAQKGENYYYILENNGNYTIEKMNTDTSNIGEGYTIVTANNFEGGTMSFNPGDGKTSILIFNDIIDAEYNFNVISGEVTIYIDNDMTLTNQGMKRSAINIEPNAVLNLHIAEGKTLTVDSGYGEDGEKGNDQGAAGGPGGYAGIRVPKTQAGEAILNVYGEGTLIAIGGDAGDGGISTGVMGGGGRWRCRSWNWWKWRKRWKS